MEIIDWNRMSELGLIERINREILHPFGLAMSRNPETGFSESILVADDGAWEYDPEMPSGVLSDNEIRRQVHGAQIALDHAPLGTKAPAVGGGHWIKTQRGWRWPNGATFPRPGGDWTGELVVADAPSALQPIPQVPEGWGLVPLELTREMFTAAEEATDGECRGLADAWPAMLAAAPSIVAKAPASPHEWDESGERCERCGEKDWFAGPACEGRLEPPVTN